MVLIHDRILKIDIYNFEMSQITPEKSLKSNQIYSVGTLKWRSGDTLKYFSNKPKYFQFVRANEFPIIGEWLVCCCPRAQTQKSLR